MSDSAYPSQERSERAVGGPTASARNGARFSRPRAADLAFAALVALLFAVSPLTGSSRLVPSLVLGSLTGAGVLLSRMRRPPVAEQQAWLLALPSPAVWTLLSASALAFGPTLLWLYDQYTINVWRNGHGLFVPLFMILLARNALRRDGDAREESSAWGFAFLLPALALLLADAGMRTHYVSAIALVIALPGLSLLLLGARRTRRIAFPLALGIFLIPLPTSFENLLGLSMATAVGAESIMSWLGAPVIRQSSVILLPNGALSVSQNCSGASALYASLAFATMLAGTDRSRAHGLLLLALTGPLILALNTLRAVALIGMTVRLGGDVLHLPIHGLSGISVFAAALLALWLLADRKAFREAIA